jgi:hypothetical protein
MAAASTGCGAKRGYPVEFIVPDGFHGIFVIEEVSEGGTEPEFVEGSYRYVIPESGVLKTTDARPFYRWHSESARFASGKEISNMKTPSRGGPHILISLATDSDGRSTWLIGTKDEANQYWKDFVIWFRVELPKK